MVLGGLGGLGGLGIWGLFLKRWRSGVYGVRGTWTAVGAVRRYAARALSSGEGEDLAKWGAGSQRPTISNTYYSHYDCYYY